MVPVLPALLGPPWCSLGVTAPVYEIKKTLFNIHSFRSRPPPVKLQIGPPRRRGLQTKMVRVLYRNGFAGKRLTNQNSNLPLPIWIRKMLGHS